MKRNSPVELPDGYVEFYKALETWQNEQQIKLQKNCAYSKVDNILPLLSEQKRPIIIIGNFIIDPHEYKMVFGDLLTFISKSRPELQEMIEAISKDIVQLDYDQLIKDLLNSKYETFATLAENYGTSTELLVFLFEHAVRPFLRIYAAPYQKELTEDTFQHWDFPSLCPVCGSKSHFSRLRPIDSRRFMFCDRCFIEWEAKYLQCIHCGNDTPGTIKYLSIENDDAYQIYTCEECKGYLKTYDEKQGGRSTDLFIANIETIYLDMLAQEKGYTDHDI